MVARFCKLAEITTKAGHLTKERFTSLLHTVDTLLVKDLLDN